MPQTYRLEVPAGRADSTDAGPLTLTLRNV